LVSVHINPELVVFGRVFYLCGQKIVCDAVTDKKKQAKIKILNERNAVNRFMLEFAELEKEF